MPNLKSFAVLSRQAFDDFVEGELKPWRRCVKKWQESKSKPEWAADTAIQAFLDSAHDEPILNCQTHNDALQITFHGGSLLRSTGIKAVTIDPKNEKPPFAFLYGEVFRIDTHTFMHLLCDVVDIYVLSKNVELARFSDLND
jgi:hypothetical protein